jgi:hypothetical protein
MGVVGEHEDTQFAILDGVVTTLNEITKGYNQDAVTIGAKVSARVRIPAVSEPNDDRDYESSSFSVPLTIDDMPYPSIGDAISVRIDW